MPRPDRAVPLLAALAALALGAAAGRARADAPVDGDPPVAAAEARHRWLSRLDGRHFAAHITLRIERGGRPEERKLQLWRDDRDGSRERVMVRFETPFDMRGFSLLYLENADKPNDYFVYRPSSRRVRRVPETLARQDVYGVDLEYLGFGVALIEPTEVESIALARLDGQETVRLTERALHTNQRFERRLVWLDPRTWIPVRTEHRLGGETRLRARTLEIRRIQGVPTPVRVRFERPSAGETITMLVDRVDYRAPIPDEFFSTFELLKGR